MPGLGVRRWERGLIGRGPEGTVGVIEMFYRMILMILTRIWAIVK